MKLSPDDLLWLAILERDTKIAWMSESGVRKYLKKRKFPERLIDAYIRRRAILFEE